MFAAHEVKLGLDFPAAKDRLALLMRGDWLDGMSHDAYADGLAGQMRVGPFGSVPGMSKLVQVSLLQPVSHDEGVAWPLRWEATGLRGRLFPVLDADLILSKREDGQTVLRLMGVYRPPLAKVGQALDEIVLHRIATATMRSLLARIVALVDDGASGPAGGRQN